MKWLGQWRNQFGSVVDITDETGHAIAGTFRTALPDSGFYGQTIPIAGIHQGDGVSFAGGGRTAAGDMIVAYTGLLRDGKMETLWFVAADAAITATAEGVPAQVNKLGWWRSMTTNADTFERM